VERGVFFDIIMSQWANVMYCSKAKYTLFACVSSNIHYAKQQFKKKNFCFSFHGEAFMEK